METQKFFIGDKVYPNDYCGIEDYAYDLADGVDKIAPPEKICGIITEVSSNGMYCITWVNSDTRLEEKIPIKNAWWDETELTNDREIFLAICESAIDDALEMIKECEEYE